MMAQRTKSTGAELALRAELHRRNLRYRLQQQPVPGLRRTADLIFRPSRVVVMVDGCFWHCCPVHGTMPRANGDWWEAKLRRNVERDRETDSKLAESGWLVIRVWEHESPSEAANRVEQAVRSRRAPQNGFHTLNGTSQ